jgi:hypothetical protein
MSGHGSHAHSDNPEHKRIGIFIGVIAVIMAVVGALAKQQANEMIVKEVKASNGFAWYQAKRQRAYLNELEVKRIDFELVGQINDAQRKVLETNRAKFLAKNVEYEAENKEILHSAEVDRDAAQTAAHKHHWFEFAEIALHIAIVLCSLVLLTNQRVFFHTGIAATLVGIGLAIFAYGVGPHAAPAPSPAPAAAPAPAAKAH